MPSDRNFEIDLWRQKHGSRNQQTHPEVPLVEWDGSEEPRAEEIIFCRQVLTAGAELMGDRWPQFLDECQTTPATRRLKKDNGPARSAGERNRVYRGRKIMNQWAEENG